MTLEAVGLVCSKAIVDKAFQAKLLSGGFSLNDLLNNQEFTGLDKRCKSDTNGCKNREYARIWRECGVLFFFKVSKKSKISLAIGEISC